MPKTKPKPSLWHLDFMVDDHALVPIMKAISQEGKRGRVHNMRPPQLVQHVTGGRADQAVDLNGRTTISVAEIKEMMTESGRSETSYSSVIDYLRADGKIRKTKQRGVYAVVRAGAKA